MLFDSKGKLFGKISIVDIIVILVIVLAIAAGCIRLTIGNSADSAENTSFYYTINIKNIRESNKICFEKSIGTEFRLGGGSDKSMGDLVDVQIFDAESVIFKTDGTIVTAKVPERYDLVLTFKVDGKVDADGYYTKDDVEINSATNYNITNIYSNVSGVVGDIWTE